MHSVCRCSLPVWRRSFLKKGTPCDLFWPRPGSGWKTTTLVRDHEYFIPTKFHQNLSSGSEEEVENVKVYRRTAMTDGRTDDGHCAMTIAHLSLWLRWAKKYIYSVIIILPVWDFTNFPFHYAVMDSNVHKSKVLVGKSCAILCNCRGSCVRSYINLGR